MTAAWVLYVLATGALLSLGAMILAAASRQLGWSTRFSFAGALAGILAFAVVAPRPAAVDRSAPVRAVVATTPAARGEHEPTLVERLRSARAMVGAEAIALSDAMQRRVSPTVQRAVLAAWLGLSATLLLLFVLVNRRFATARRNWPSRSLHGTAVRVAPRLGPAVLGFLRAEIVVPRALLARSDEDQRLILAHEREHVRTRDHLLLGGAWLCAIVFPWHPAVWYLTNRVRLAIELDCDARVLRGGASPRSYGALLIDMAARQSAVRIGALALADGPSHLERRIRAMQWTRGRLAAARGLVLGGMGGLLVLAACEAKVPTSAEIAAMDVASAQRTATKAGFMRTPSDHDVDYFINGVKSSAEQANTLDGKKIGSVEVVKSEHAAGRDTIYVTTLDRMPTAEKTPLLGATWKMLESKERTDARTKQTSGAQPVFLIDGRKATVAEVAALPESRIRSVSVQKTDGTGINPDAANGVISIETRAKQ